MLLLGRRWQKYKLNGESPRARSRFDWRVPWLVAEFVRGSERKGCNALKKE